MMETSQTPVITEPEKQPLPAKADGARPTVGGVFDPATMDIGRILAASVIFYFHLGLFMALPLSFPGEQAVDYFVMAAGMAYILFGESRPARWPEYFAYIRKRLWALWPAYLLVNVAIYAGSFACASGLGRAFSLGEFLASATGVSLYLHWKYMSTVMWFMPFIVQVYLLLPLLERAARRIHPAVLMLVAFGVSGLLAQMVGWLEPTEVAARLVCKNWSPVFRLPEVCLGVILARGAQQGSGWGGGLLAVAVFGGLSGLVSWVEPVHRLLRLHMPWSGVVVPGLIFGAAAGLAAAVRGVKATWLRRLGQAAFPFFLLHAAPMGALSRRTHQPTVWLAYFVGCWGLALGIILLLARIKGRTGDRSETVRALNP